MLHLVCAADKSERLYVDCARARGGVDGDCLSCTSGKTPPHPLCTAYVTFVWYYTLIRVFGGIE